MNVIVLMAGNSDEFYKDGSKFPKYLYEISGKPLAEHVINNLAPVASKFIFLINKHDAQKWHLESVIKLLVPQSEVYIVEGDTKGAACSALYAIESINNDQELLIANGDQFLDTNLAKELKELQKYDGGTIVFESVHPRWSYVNLDSDNLIVEASEKRPISKNATAGIYYFKHGKDFVKGASEMIKKDASVNDSFFICPVFNEMILNHKRLGITKIDRKNYHSLTTVEAMKNFTAHLER